MPTQNNSGSPAVGEPEYLLIGLLRRPHGLRGELLLEVYTDFPERLKPGVTVFAGEGYQPLKITGRRDHNDGLLMAFQGINTPEEAGRWRNAQLYVRATGRPALPEGEYYQHELIGLDVVTLQGRKLGTLTEILETGANNVYVVSDAAGKEMLLPAIPDVIREVDLQAAVIRVHLLPGLLDEE